MHSVNLIERNLYVHSGHRVATSGGKCRSPHGHTYYIHVEIQGTVNEDESSTDYGMLTDFSNLGNLMDKYIYAPMDHAMIIHRDDNIFKEGYMTLWPDFKVLIFPYIPTAENIARWVWDVLEAPLFTMFGHELKLSKIDVWETPKSKATHYR